MLSNIDSEKSFSSTPLYPNSTDRRDESTAEENQRGSPRKKRTCAGRTVIAIGTTVAHVFTNMFLGSVKGLELAASGPCTFLGHHARKIGKDGSKTSKAFGYAGNFAGIIVGIVAAVPGLLLGTVYGLGRGIITVPKAVKTAINDGFCNAMRTSKNYYAIDMNKVYIVLTVARILLVW